MRKLLERMNFWGTKNVGPTVHATVFTDGGWRSLGGCLRLSPTMRPISKLGPHKAL
jgi:hypothetical protein